MLQHSLGFLLNPAREIQRLREDGSNLLLIIKFIEGGDEFSKRAYLGVDSLDLVVRCESGRERDLSFVGFSELDLRHGQIA